MDFRMKSSGPDLGIEGFYRKGREAGNSRKAKREKKYQLACEESWKLSVAQPRWKARARVAALHFYGVFFFCINMCFLLKDM
jgi:hypothetical protein